jgi:hypothetical protein
MDSVDATIALARARGAALHGPPLPLLFGDGTVMKPPGGLVRGLSVGEPAVLCGVRDPAGLDCHGVGCVGALRATGGEESSAVPCPNKLSHHVDLAYEDFRATPDAACTAQPWHCWKW